MSESRMGSQDPASEEWRPNEGSVRVQAPSQFDAPFLPGGTDVPFCGVCDPSSDVGDLRLSLCRDHANYGS
jgi:hypothetical protein